MKLSIVINTYNRLDALRGTCAVLAAQAGGEQCELVVVNDGGADPADVVARSRPEELDAARWRTISIEHGGRSAARNAGVAAATGERVLFLGDDVRLQDGALLRHLALDEPWVAKVGPYPWQGLVGSPAFKRWAEPNPQNDIEDVNDAGFRYFATGNISMDRAVFDQLGGFDERYRVYGWEDIDLGLKFERAGGRLEFDAGAAAVHDHPGMTRAKLWQREYEMGQTAWQFYEKWRDTATDDIAFMKFWDDASAIEIGPGWRRALGKFLIGVLDAVAPGSSMNERMYERMVYAQRLAGVKAAWAAHE